MCGILGLIQNQRDILSDKNFAKLNSTNINRGPDNQNIISLDVLHNKVMLGHTRLSIQDLSTTANQPMISSSGRFIISFNGEIYNHFNLRKKINQKIRVKWNSNSDTETLLNLFECFEIKEVLQMLEGMFAFILIDNKLKKIHISRDLAGEKPLYIYCDDKSLMFSSDLKAIKDLPFFDRNINNHSLQQYLEFNYVPNPNTIFMYAYKLPASSYLSIDLDKFKFQKFKDFNSLINNHAINFEYWWELNLNNNSYRKLSIRDVNLLVHEKLKNSVKKQLISDAPLGAFLSGGIDSSLIVSLMQEIQSQTKTFTIGFEDKDYDESLYANKIANTLSTDHENYKFSNSEVIKYIENIPSAYSEPFADSSQIPTLLVSNIAKQKVKVVLTGDGGDELFGGYNRYIYANKYWKYFKLFNSNFRNRILSSILSINTNISYKLINNLLKLNLNRNSIKKINHKLLTINNEQSYYLSLIREWSKNDMVLNSSLNFDSKNNYFNQIFENENLNIEEKMMISDFNSYLQDDILCKVDRGTMYYSLESRAPFLDKSVIDLAMNLPLKTKLDKGNSKIVLRNILKNYLPEELINQKKMGFGIPLGSLFRKELKNWVYDNLLYQSSELHNFFNLSTVKKFVDEHMNNKANHQYKLWSLLQFNLWYRNFYKN
tara:strand:- start:12972 stop:14945 length:1974 start_codon:yes stop_codon:yes gene_type:complete